MTRNRRGPVIESACADCLPSCVSPLRAVIGLGTMSCSVANSPRQSSREASVKIRIRFAATQQRVTGKERINQRFGMRVVIVKADRRSFPEIHQPAAVTNDCFALFLIHSSAISVRRELVVT